MKDFRILEGKNYEMSKTKSFHERQKGDKKQCEPNSKEI